MVAPRARLLAIDGWRGVACILIAVYHLNAEHSFIFNGWLRSGAPVLELFFLISGFVMAFGFADSVKSARDYVAFLTRRVGRGMPLHWFTLGLLVPLALAKAVLGNGGGAGEGSMAWGALPAQILLVQTWIPGLGLTWNFPAWTLSAELAAYLIFGFLVMLIRGRSERIIAAAALVVIAGILFHRELGPRESYNVISVWRCLTGFYIGFIIHDIWRWRQIQSPRLASVLEIGILAAGIYVVGAGFDGAAYFLNHLVLGVFVWVFASDRGIVSKIVATPVLLWFGKVSFSLYMIHAVVKLYLQNVFYALERFTGQQFYFWYDNPHGHPLHLISLGAPWMNDLLLVTYMAVSIMAAALVFRFVEDPTRVYMSGLAKRIQKAPPEQSMFAPWLAPVRRVIGGLRKRAGA